MTSYKHLYIYKKKLIDQRKVETTDAIKLKFGYFEMKPTKTVFLQN